MATGRPGVEAPLVALVLGTEPWAVEQGARALERAGHRVMRCVEPGETGLGCAALDHGARCPLDEAAPRATVKRMVDERDEQFQG